MGALQNRNKVSLCSFCPITPSLYINEEKVTNWYLAEGLSLPQAKYHISDFFDVSILNKKDLDNDRNLNNNVFYQSFNGLTAIMSDGERIINIFKTADSLNG